MTWSKTARATSPGLCPLIMMLKASFNFGTIAIVAEYPSKSPSLRVTFAKELFLCLAKWLIFHIQFLSAYFLLLCLLLMKSIFSTSVQGFAWPVLINLVQTKVVMNCMQWCKNRDNNLQTVHGVKKIYYYSQDSCAADWPPTVYQYSRRYSHNHILKRGSTFLPVSRALKRSQRLLP